jgi:glycosyltransferase involved in cell wall biosynthesis
LAFWAARKVRAKFILGLASDLDAMGFISRLKYNYLVSTGGLWLFFNTILIEMVYPYLLRKSDIVLVQHLGQKQILLQKHIKSIVFPNLIDLTQIPVISNPIHNDYIYVGSLDERKGFAEFFELVKKDPLHSYVVVGQPRDKTGYLYYEKLKSFGNVSLLGRLSHYDTIHQIANSRALISTSQMEGFPNVFIEAWASGVPVLSLYTDPGGIIKKEKLGEVTNGNLDKLLQAMEDSRNKNEFAKRAKAYVVQNHALEANKTKEISDMFNELINCGK